MTDPTITDLRRELEKARESLDAARTHLARHAEANAALHCAERVLYSPLHAKIDAAVVGIEHALARTQATNPVHSDAFCPWVRLVSDLTRCQHGRHEGDPCGPDDACTGTSAGNPHVRPGDVIGYDRYGDPIVMPDREHKHDPASWRPEGGR
ncbi:hypothetical protein [Streptomyces sp. WMMC897]|uniref:hypothetical protein n=1 Tax=Streptomyces sp. WMMC897 TaxID=3014782 RepID=UPI0022B648EF|nr:hypothetical protein [Streptomyces sp. WMMC897]MCZ7414294.1 hypothetical protein [Streptomyces sp. WMMC897]